MCVCGGGGGGGDDDDTAVGFPIIPKGHTPVYLPTNLGGTHVCLSSHHLGRDTHKFFFPPPQHNPEHQKRTICGEDALSTQVLVGGDKQVRILKTKDP